MRYVLGIIFGLAAGLAVGLLLAPSPGLETRQKLRDRAEPAIERFRQRVRRAEEAA